MAITAGKYQVKIHGAYWAKLPSRAGDDNRIKAVLPGVVTIDGKQEVIEADLLFVDTIIGSGKNAGKKVAMVSNDKLIELGMVATSNGLIDPSKLEEQLEGKEAEYVVEINDKGYYQVAFINPPRANAISVDKAISIYNNLLRSGTTGSAPTIGKQVEQGYVDDGSDIPF